MTLENPTEQRPCTSPFFYSLPARNPKEASQDKEAQADRPSTRPLFFKNNRLGPLGLNQISLRAHQDAWVAELMLYACCYKITLKKSQRMIFCELLRFLRPQTTETEFSQELRMKSWSFAKIITIAKTYKHTTFAKFLVCLGSAHLGGMNYLLLTVCLSAHFTDWLLC